MANPWLHSSWCPTHPNTVAHYFAPKQVLLLPPNVVGHVRLALLLAATALPKWHVAASALLLAASLALDALDGYLARRLNQV